MIPQYIKASFFEVSTGNDSFLVHPDCVGKDPAIEDFKPYVEGTPESFEAVPGWFCRLSAPGYLDATEWSGPFERLSEAQKSLRDTFDVDPDTGISLDDEDDGSADALEGNGHG
jgi:hypothetical protein